MHLHLLAVLLTPCHQRSPGRGIWWLALIGTYRTDVVEEGRLALLGTYQTDVAEEERVSICRLALQGNVGTYPELTYSERGHGSIRRLALLGA